MDNNIKVRTAVSPIEELKPWPADLSWRAESVRTAVSPIEELKLSGGAGGAGISLVRTAVSPIEELKLECLCFRNEMSIQSEQRLVRLRN